MTMTVKATQCLCISIILFLGAGWLGTVAFSCLLQVDIGGFILTGFGSTLFFLFGLIMWTISGLHPSNSHSWATLMFQFVAWGPMGYLGDRKVAHLAVEAENTRKTQETILLEILKNNADTAYGIDHKFNEIHSREEYIASHPLTDHSHYEEYVRRIVDEGEGNLMFKEPLEHVALTSGTTGKSKQLPINAQYKDINIGLMYTSALNKRFKSELRRVLSIHYRPKPSGFTPNGVPIAPLGHYIVEHYPSFLNPRVVCDINSEKEAMYVHALFALAEPDLGCMNGKTSSLLYSFFMVIENNWEQLCRDIQKGELNPNIKIDADIRSKVEQQLSANPDRASVLEQEFKKGFKDIARRVWPNLAGIFMFTTGSFAAYTQLLKETYVGDDIPMSSLLHAATEGMIGLGLTDDPLDQSYVLVPNILFLEFIEESQVNKEQPKTCFMEEVEKGKSYEVVVTNRCGLYRYRLGDVIKITDKIFQNCATYEFQYRLGQLLNLAFEKTSENVFYKALVRTLSNWPEVRLIDYTSVENVISHKVDGSPMKSKHYVLYVELQDDEGNFRLTDDQKAKFDQSLCEESELYGSLHSANGIAPMEVVQIQNGGFQSLRSHMNSGVENLNFKMPRVLRNEDHLRFLLGDSMEEEHASFVRKVELLATERGEEYMVVKKTSSIHPKTT